MSDTGSRAHGVLERFFVHAGAEAHDGDPKGAAQRVEHAHKKPGREHEVAGLDAYGDWPGQARVLHDRIRETIWVHDIVICAEATPVMVFRSTHGLWQGQSSTMIWQGLRQWREYRGGARDLLSLLLVVEVCVAD